jgi:peptidoglycan/LPS O-acetylase OafA/YrhL
VYYGFAQIYYADRTPGGIGQAWTLCVEVTFYAFLPLYAAALTRVRSTSPRGWLWTEGAGLAILIAFSIGYKAWALSRIGPSTQSHATLLMPLPNFLDYFAIGMGLAVASLGYEVGLLRGCALTALRRWPSLPWLIAMVAFVGAGHFLGLPGVAGTARAADQVMARHALYALIALGLVMPAVTFGSSRGVARRILALRPLLWLGLVSYGIYLWHLGLITKLILHWGVPTTPSRSVAFLAVVLAGSVVVAAGSYYCVEGPALRLNRLFASADADSDQPGAASAPARP